MKQATGRKRAQRMFPMKQCEMCGGATTLQRHHVDGNVMNNDPDNVKVLCQKCHTKVHMMIGNWGKGAVKIAACLVCGKSFKPKRTRRAKLCGSVECAKEQGRRSAALRWG